MRLLTPPLQPNRCRTAAVCGVGSVGGPASYSSRPVTSPTGIELMPAFYSAPTGLSSPAATRPVDLLRRRPQRITFSTSWQLHQTLQERADREGRSLSNLISHLLEVATS